MMSETEHQPSTMSDHASARSTAAARAENTLLRKQLADVMEVVGTFAAKARPSSTA